MVLLTAAPEATEALALEEDFLGAATFLDSVREDFCWGAGLRDDSASRGGWDMDSLVVVVPDMVAVVLVVLDEICK
jgi:hypothetical protein